jgi:hypothetical protein
MASGPLFRGEEGWVQVDYGTPPAMEDCLITAITKAANPLTVKVWDSNPTERHLRGFVPTGSFSG